MNNSRHHRNKQVRRIREHCITISLPDCQITRSNEQRKSGNKTLVGQSGNTDIQRPSRPTSSQNGKEFNIWLSLSNLNEIIVGLNDLDVLPSLHDLEVLSVPNDPYVLSAPNDPDVFLAPNDRDDFPALSDRDALPQGLNNQDVRTNRRYRNYKRTEQSEKSEISMRLHSERRAKVFKASVRERKEKDSNETGWGITGKKTRACDVDETKHGFQQSDKRASNNIRYRYPKAYHYGLTSERHTIPSALRVRAPYQLMPVRQPGRAPLPVNTSPLRSRSRQPAQRVAQSTKVTSVGDDGIQNKKRDFDSGKVAGIQSSDKHSAVVRNNADDKEDTLPLTDKSPLDTTSPLAKNKSSPLDEIKSISSEICSTEADEMSPSSPVLNGRSYDEFKEEYEYDFVKSKSSDDTSDACLRGTDREGGAVLSLNVRYTRSLKEKEVKQGRGPSSESDNFEYKSDFESEDV